MRGRSRNGCSLSLFLALSLRSVYTNRRRFSSYIYVVHNYLLCSMDRFSLYVVVVVVVIRIINFSYAFLLFVNKTVRTEHIHWINKIRCLFKCLFFFLLFIFILLLSTTNLSLSHNISTSFTENIGFETNFQISSTELIPPCLSLSQHIAVFTRACNLNGLQMAQLVCALSIVLHFKFNTKSVRISPFLVSLSLSVWICEQHSSTNVVYC